MASIIWLILLVLLVLGAIIFSITFWIMMIIDCAKRTFKTDNEKVVWILVIALIGILGATVYYLAVKRNPEYKSLEKNKKQ